MAFFDNVLSENDLHQDEIFDGRNKIIPEGTILSCLVTGGFHGIYEGQANMAVDIYLQVAEQGKFFDQAYTFAPKLYPKATQKNPEKAINNAKKQLAVIDAQAGFPMTDGRLDLTTENIEALWARKAYIRVEFGYMLQETNMDGSPILDDQGMPTTREINFIRGIGYDRAKMIQPGQESQEQAQQSEQLSEPQYQEPTAQQMAGSATDENDDDIDF